MPSCIARSACISLPSQTTPRCLQVRARLWTGAGWMRTDVGRDGCLLVSTGRVHATPRAYRWFAWLLGMTGGAQNRAPREASRERLAMSLRSHRGLRLSQCFNAAFCLRHVVSINFSGKTVLVMLGVGVAASSSTDDFVRAVAIVNAVCMALGQCWYSVWWQTDEKINDFVRGETVAQHGLHCLGACPSMLLLLAAMYYASFTALFAAAAVRVASEDGAEGFTYAYAVGAASWHLWCGALLLLSACLHCMGCEAGDTPRAKVDPSASVESVPDPLQRDSTAASCARSVLADRQALLPQHTGATRGMFKFELGAHVVTL